MWLASDSIGSSGPKRITKVVDKTWLRAHPTLYDWALTGNIITPLDHVLGIILDAGVDHVGIPTLLDNIRMISRQATYSEK
jgi:hypothetical protein